jgi:hypothetical protein
VDASEVIQRMEQLLVEERAAIARLDGATVAALAEQKLGLAHELQAAPAPDRARVAVPLKRLVKNLKNNGVLLAQAGAILAEVLMGPGATIRRLSSVTGRPPSTIRARHLSIRG